jgi:hypothetical protein
MFFSSGSCSGKFSGSIAALVNRMLIFAPSDRPAASELLNGWMGLFETLCKEARGLEGRVF